MHVQLTCSVPHAVMFTCVHDIVMVVHTIIACNTSLLDKAGIVTPVYSKHILPGVLPGALTAANASISTADILNAAT